MKISNSAILHPRSLWRRAKVTRCVSKAQNRIPHSRVGLRKDAQKKNGLHLQPFPPPRQDATLYRQEKSTEQLRKLPVFCLCQPQLAG
ncbi:MAG: hypothetical protein ACI9G1_004911 [Pirellulaceae bacterium]|jgi:hypothetical protein